MTLWWAKATQKDTKSLSLLKWWNPCFSNAVKGKSRIPLRWMHPIPHLISHAGNCLVLLCTLSEIHYRPLWILDTTRRFYISAHWKTSRSNRKSLRSQDHNSRIQHSSYRPSPSSLYQFDGSQQEGFSCGGVNQHSKSPVILTQVFFHCRVRRVAPLSLGIDSRNWGWQERYGCVCACLESWGRGEFDK